MTALIIKTILENNIAILASQSVFREITKVAEKLIIEGIMADNHAGKTIQLKIPVMKKNHYVNYQIFVNKNCIAYKYELSTILYYPLDATKVGFDYRS